MEKGIFVAPGGHELLTGPPCLFDVTHSLFTVNGSDQARTTSETSIRSLIYYIMYRVLFKVLYKAVIYTRKPWPVMPLVIISR